MRSSLSVGQLRASLATFDQTAPLVIEGTSVAIRPQLVRTLESVREDPGEPDWSYEGCARNTVVILTDGSFDRANEVPS